MVYHASCDTAMAPIFCVILCPQPLRRGKGHNRKPLLTRLSTPGNRQRIVFDEIGRNPAVFTGASSYGKTARSGLKRRLGDRAGIWGWELDIGEKAFLLRAT